MAPICKQKPPHTVRHFVFAPSFCLRDLAFALHLRHPKMDFSGALSVYSLTLRHLRALLLRRFPFSCTLHLALFCYLLLYYNTVFQKIKRFVKKMSKKTDCRMQAVFSFLNIRGDHNSRKVKPIVLRAKQGGKRLFILRQLFDTQGADPVVVKVVEVRAAR